MQRLWGQCLVEEQGSHLPQGMEKKKKNLLFLCIKYKLGSNTHNVECFDVVGN